MSNFKLLVVIPTQNRSSFVKKHAEIFRRVIHNRKNVKVTIVDDFSNEIERGELLNIQSEFKAIRFVFLPERKGAPVARNVGAELSEGTLRDWIWFLDDDDFVDEDLIIQLIEFLDNLDDNDKLVLLSSEVDGRLTNPQTDHLNKLYRNKGQDVNTSCLIMRYPIFEMIGRWDESLVAGQDTDLFLRVSQIIDQATSCREVVVTRNLESNDRITKSAARQMKAKAQFIRKHWKHISFKRLMRYIVTFVLFIPYIKKLRKFRLKNV